MIESSQRGDSILRALTQITTTRPDNGAEFGEYLRVLLRGGGLPFDALQRAGDNISPRVERVLKAASIAGTTAPNNWAGAAVDYHAVVSGFVESLKTTSIFYRMLSDGGIRRAPLWTRVLLAVANADAWIKMEGLPVPVSELDLDAGGIDVVTAASIIVLSKSLVESTSSGAQALMMRELRNAVSKAVDAEFLNLITDSSTPGLVSSGVNDAAVRADILALLAEVNVGASEDAALYWLASPGVANAMTVVDPHGTMGPRGGSFYNLPALVSDVLPAGRLALVDAAGVAGDSHTVTVNASDQASLEMSTTPSGNATIGAGASLVSLWQLSAIGFLAKADFGVRRMREGALAIMDGIAWGTEES